MGAGSRLGCSISNLAVCNYAWEGLSTWAPVTHTGDLTGVPGVWLQHGPTLDTAGVWGVNKQQMEDLCFFSLSLYFSLLKK